MHTEGTLVSPHQVAGDVPPSWRYAMKRTRVRGGLGRARLRDLRDLALTGLMVVALTGCTHHTSESSASGAAAVTAMGTRNASSLDSVSADPRARTVDWAAMQAFWNAASALPGFDTGPATATKRMVVMFDPDCPACAMQYRALEPYLDRIRIHWVPVGYLRPDSARKAAGILSAKDPAAALAANELHYDFRNERGGALVSASVPAQALAEVKANTASATFNQPVAATPMLGLELYPGKRYWRHPGAMGPEAMQLVYEELGNTLDPYARTQAILHARAVAAHATSGRTTATTR